MAAASTAPPINCGYLSHVIASSVPTSLIAATAAKKLSHSCCIKEVQPVLYCLAAKALPSIASAASTTSAVAGASFACCPSSSFPEPAAASSADWPEAAAAAAHTAAAADAAPAADAVAVVEDAAAADTASSAATEAAAADALAAVKPPGAAHAGAATDGTTVLHIAAADATAVSGRRLYIVEAPLGQKATAGFPGEASILSKEAVAVETAGGRNHEIDGGEVAEGLTEAAQSRIAVGIAATREEKERDVPAAKDEEEEGHVAPAREDDGRDAAVAEEEQERDAAVARETEERDVAFAGQRVAMRQCEKKAALGGASANQLELTVVREEGIIDFLTDVLYGDAPSASNLEGQKGETAAIAEAAQKIAGSSSPLAETVQVFPLVPPVGAGEDKCFYLSPLKAPSSFLCWAAPVSPSGDHNSSVPQAARPPLLSSASISLSSSVISGHSPSSKTTLSSECAITSRPPDTSCLSPLSSTSHDNCTGAARAGPAAVATPTVTKSAAMHGAAWCAAILAGSPGRAAAPAAAASTATPNATSASDGSAVTPAATGAVPRVARAVAAEAPAATATFAASRGASAASAAAATPGAALEDPATCATVTVWSDGATRAAAERVAVLGAAATPAAADTPADAATPAAAVTPAAASTPDTATPAGVGGFLGSGGDPPPTERGLLVSEAGGRTRRRKRLRVFFHWAGQVLPLLISLLSFLLTLWYYTSMVRLTQHLQQANTTSAIYAEYSSAKTLAALELLEDFIERHGLEHYPFCYLHLRQQRTAEGRELDRARRHLTQWFSRIQYFYDFGYLHAAHMQRFPGPQRTRYFLDLVEPLEYVSRKTTGRKHAAVFDFLRRVYNLHEHRLDPVFVQRVKRLIKKGKKRGRDGGGGGGGITRSIDSSNSCCRSSITGGDTGCGRKKFGNFDDEINSSHTNLAECASGSVFDSQMFDGIEKAQRKGSNYCQVQPRLDVTCGCLGTKSPQGNATVPLGDPQGGDGSSGSTSATVENIDKQEEEEMDEVVSSSECGEILEDATFGGAAKASMEIEGELAEDGDREDAALGEGRNEDGRAQQVSHGDVKEGTRKEGRSRYREDTTQTVLIDTDEDIPAGNGRKSISSKRKRDGMPEGTEIFKGSEQTTGEPDSLAGRIFHVRKAGVPYWPTRGVRKIKLFEGSLLESAEREEEVEDDEDEDEEEDVEEEDFDELSGGEIRMRASQKIENETAAEGAGKKYKPLCKRTKRTAARDAVSAMSGSSSAENLYEKKDSAAISLEDAPVDKGVTAAAAKDTGAGVIAETATGIASSGARGAADGHGRKIAGSSKTTTTEQKRREESTTSPRVLGRAEEL